MHLPRVVVAVDVSNYLYSKFVDPLVADCVAWAEEDDTASSTIKEIVAAHHSGSKDAKVAAQAKLRALLTTFLGQRRTSITQSIEKDLQDPRVLLGRLLSWLNTPEYGGLSSDQFEL
jgi:hypothetical protein